MFQELKRQLKYLRYYLKHGVHPYTVWNLDNYIVKYALPRIKLLREHTHCSPPYITYEEWLTVLNDIIWSFENYEEMLSDKEDILRKRKGEELFGKYWTMLWD